ncbi:3'(2'),5'-bisphosphate nucleotidase CysQ [Buchnera aphidicola (Thelaxes californica)]|uniref:3'(2'),5'-bisphosphate nucleotidase CysQ n=1 Tax=Buchnera aphidicola (Thelaxes californica) TaxID=1315998 RepID=A0A4D6YP75_9GAMM|nr:inositol monophosphatase family protein [Buchnera aphidicola]QCI26955.1 3'(2'),5'-bisphosphate nucleotidase CysQ [Buchnera aphidicola (Thelaxes californica)]
MINEILAISKEAGNIIMDVYNKISFFDDNVITFKEKDHSPLTIADKDSHEIIVKGLCKLDKNIPVLSEESHFFFDSNWKNQKLYWLIDPLDGTKEFIKKIPEFTVNIALIYNNNPILGVIYVPFLDTFYYFFLEKSWKKVSNFKPKQIFVKKKKTHTVLLSRSHVDQNTYEYVDKNINKKYKIKKMGSSLKFCLIAEGKAQLYPRCNPVYKWDIAAGHAIIIGAGGHIQTFSGSVINYQLKNHNSILLNSGFIVSSYVL